MDAQRATESPWDAVTPLLSEELVKTDERFTRYDRLLAWLLPDTGWSTPHMQRYHRRQQAKQIAGRYARLTIWATVVSLALGFSLIFAAAILDYQLTHEPNVACRLLQVCPPE